MKHSTSAPNREEAAYMAACKWDDPHDGTWAVCTICELISRREDAPPGFVKLPAHHFHHFKSGNVRIGHLYGIGACVWHHEGDPVGQMTHREMRDYYGVSLKGGSATFHDAYGSDAELLDFQDQLLRQRGITPPVRPDNRRWSHAA